MQIHRFVLQLSRAIFALALASTLAGLNSKLPVQAQEGEPVQRVQFDLLTANSGWVSLDQQLYWTSDAGVAWKEISPSLPAGAKIEDVEFIDIHRGWVMWTMPGSGDETIIQLAHTVDQGNTWMVLSPFDAGDSVRRMRSAQMGWLDAETGWLSLKLESGSNFSIGSLFTTSDGGSHWRHFTLPVADRLYFSDPQTGWAVGGPSGDQVFRTQDGGASWVDNRPAELPRDAQAVVYPPVFSDGQGLLVTTALGEFSRLSAFSLSTSDSWTVTDQFDLDLQPGVIGLSILDPRNFVAAIPGTSSIVRMADGRFDTLENLDGLSASITELDMVSLDIGWAKWVDASCSTTTLPGNTSASCASIIRLLRTTDGGVSWSSVQLPGLQSDPISIEYPDVKDDTLAAGDDLGLENTEIFIGQGFDRCEIPTLSQMQTWWDAGPYGAVNLYIGGSSRACDNTPLTASYLFQLHQQGWKFIPTWVGPQAPCTGFNSRISSDLATAYSQGVNQANLAVDRLAFLGLTKPDQTGSVIYYDMEAYGTQQTCRDAVNSFMNGWVSQIHARGNIAGVYGSTLCYTGLSDFLSIPNVPDVIWAARWYHSLGAGYYDPTASVWNLGSCIPNTAWANHQRIRQYEGDHLENWGNLTLDIDSNALDGVVAIPYDYPNVVSIVRANISPTNVATVGFIVSFSKPVTGVDHSDFKLTTSGVANFSIAGISGSGNTYTVSVNTGTGDGSIRLDMVDNDSIRDASNNPVGGSGSGNGNYTYGPSYVIRKSSLFADVPGGYWAKNHIERLYQAGVTSGCNTEPLLYCPDLPVTRDQMAVFLLRAKHGSDYVPPAATGIFQDVPSDYWAAAWIEQLAAEDITSGCSTNPMMYCPTTPVTRDQMAVFILRAEHGASYSPSAPTGMFEDVPVDHWAAAWIEQLAAEGITSGCSTSPALYCPTTPVSRDQMSIFLVESFNLP